jgi:hypothetical protein
MLRIEIQTDDLPEDECFTHDVPLDTSKMDIMMSIECLYSGKNVTSIYIYVVDKAD